MRKCSYLAHTNTEMSIADNIAVRAWHDPILTTRYHPSYSDVETKHSLLSPELLDVSDQCGLHRLPQGCIAHFPQLGIKYVRCTFVYVGTK